jgi:6,7-dimethyl-8-ribityllumazine synthase
MRNGSLKSPEVLDATGLRFAVVAARWNSRFTDRLLAGALRALRDAGAKKGDVSVVRVPGSFELISACRRAAAGGSVSAIVSLGCLIRGETPHFDVLANSVASALAHLNATQDVPISFGVLTCDNEKQARARSGGAAGHAGIEAAEAAIEMARMRRGAIPARTRRAPGPVR